MPKTSHQKRKGRARLLHKQEKAVEAGELTQESWPYESFSKPYRKTKDGPEYIKMNWASTEEPLTAISHLPAEEIKKNWGEDYQNYTDEEIYDLLNEKINRNQIIEENLKKQKKSQT